MCRSVFWKYDYSLFNTKPMKNTLNVKLAKVLEYGSISLVTENDVAQHPEWG